MKRNNLLIISICIAFVSGLSVTLTSCSDPDPEKGILFMSQLDFATPTDSTRPQVRIFLENSMSMRGYVVRPGGVDNSDMQFEKVIGNLVSNLQYKDYSTEWLCGQKKGTTAKDLYDKGIRKGELFSGGSTLLHEYFESVSKEANDSVLTMFVSDLVFSMSAPNNPDAIKNELPKLQTLLSDALRNAQKDSDVDIMILQYMSGFYGKYYYNCTNNIRHCAFQNQKMAKRPFYIVVFGKEKQLKTLLSDTVMPKYENIWVSFTIESSDYTEKEVRIKDSDYWFVPEHEYDSLPFAFYTETNWENENSTVQLEFDSIKIPDFLDKDWKLQSKSASVDSLEKISDTQIAITFKPFDQLFQGKDNQKTETVEISLVCGRKSWSDFNIDDDVLPLDSIQSLENKTWAFGDLMDAIHEVYPIKKQEVVGSLSFLLLKK